jgi:hypothetical protein
VFAALTMAVAATLILGIVPNEVLRAAEAGAQTLRAPEALQQNARRMVISPLRGVERTPVR